MRICRYCSRSPAHGPSPLTILARGRCAHWWRMRGVARSKDLTCKACQERARRAHPFWDTSGKFAGRATSPTTSFWTVGKGERQFARLNSQVEELAIGVLNGTSSRLSQQISDCSTEHFLGHLPLSTMGAIEKRLCCISADFLDEFATADAVPTVRLALITAYCR